MSQRITGLSPFLFKIQCIQHKSRTPSLSLSPFANENKSIEAFLGSLSLDLDNKTWKETFLGVSYATVGAEVERGEGENELKKKKRRSANASTVYNSTFRLK